MKQRTSYWLSDHKACREDHYGYSHPPADQLLTASVFLENEWSRRLALLDLNNCLSKPIDLND